MQPDLYKTTLIYDRHHPTHNPDRHRGHRDWRQGHKNLCMPKANELARFAEAPPRLSNQAEDEYQRLMNNKIVIQRAQCRACMSIAERERFIQITEK